MKNIITIFFLSFVAQIAFSQSEYAFNYQGVLSDNMGKTITNKEINVRFSILSEANMSEAIYEEEHTLTTNARGVFSCQIGRGENRFGSLEAIGDSETKHFIKIEVDPGNGEYYKFGTTELLHVPYALYAENTNIKLGQGLQKTKEGTIENIGDLDTLNEIQTLAIRRDTLYISEGNGVYIGSSSRSGDGSEIDNHSNSIADLRELVPEDAHCKIKLLGYYSPNDGGGGDWYWDSASTAVDDSATIVEVIDVDTGRWTRVNDEEFINLKIFGAKGDGIENEGKNIQRSINYCSENNRVLYVPSGVYLIDGNEMGNSSIVFNEGSISIVGDSNGKSVFKEVPGATTSRYKKMFYIYAQNNDIDYFNIENIVFDKSGASSAPPPTTYAWEQAHTIEIRSASGHEVKDVNINNCTFKDKIGGHINFAVGSIKKVMIDNCEFEDFSYEYGQRGDVEFNASIENGVLQNSKGLYIQSEPDANTSQHGPEQIHILNSDFGVLDLAGYSTDNEKKSYHLYNLETRINVANVQVFAEKCNFEMRTNYIHVFRGGSEISNSKIRVQVSESNNTYRKLQLKYNSKLKFNHCDFICDQNDASTTGFLIYLSALTSTTENQGFTEFNHCNFLDPDYHRIVDGYARGNLRFNNCKFACKDYFGRFGGYNSYRGHTVIEDCDFTQVQGLTFHFVPNNEFWTLKLKGSYDLGEISMNRASGNDTRVENRFFNMAQIYGESLPASGRWFKGDFIINTNPSNDVHGWRCISSGTTGTWKEIVLE